MIPSFQELIRAAVFRAGIDDRLAAAIIASDDVEAGRIVREAATAELAEWAEIRAKEAEAHRDAFAKSEADAKARERDREAWAEMTADMRAHEAGE